MIRPLLVAFLVPWVPGPVRAQERPGEGGDRARALALFERSETEYQEGNFSEAAALLRQAYDLHSEPILLYNLGRALEGLGEAAGAIDAYGRYLAADGNAPDRGAIEQRIATLRRQIEERDALEREARAAERPRRRTATPSGANSPRPVEAPEEVEEAAPRAHTGAGRGRGPLPWIVTGVGAAGLVAGGVFGALALERHSAAVDEQFQLDAIAKQDTAETFATVSTVSLIAGGVVTAAGLLWLLVARPDGPEEPETGALRIDIGPRAVALSF
ncbi:MAG: hypothetical protein HYY06_13310 [Deltaproteobacteria bacterium]|nr:hypothetical protein [Deltaproteobacteria bacterium]